MKNWNSGVFEISVGHLHTRLARFRAGAVVDASHENDKRPKQYSGFKRCDCLGDLPEVAIGKVETSRAPKSLVRKPGGGLAPGVPSDDADGALSYHGTAHSPSRPIRQATGRPVFRGESSPDNTGSAYRSISDIRCLVTRRSLFSSF